MNETKKREKITKEENKQSLTSLFFKTCSNFQKILLKVIKKKKLLLTYTI